MPQHKSAAKRVRQTERRMLRNRIQRSKVRTLMKRLASETDKEKAEALLPVVKAQLDRLAMKNIIPRNRVARYKSRLEKGVHALS